MGFTELFADNLLIKLLRGDRTRYDLIVSMVGARLGDRLVVVGGGDGRLVAAVGAPTGLTGRICAVEPDEAAAQRVSQAATAGGVLVEVEAADPGALPYEEGSFDVAVVPVARGGDASTVVRDVRRVLRTGGRCVVVAQTPSGAVSPLDALVGAGFRAARLLAERSGLAFYEAAKVGR